MSRLERRASIALAFTLVAMAEMRLARYRAWVYLDKMDELADMTWPAMLSQADHPG